MKKFLTAFFIISLFIFSTALASSFPVEINAINFPDAAFRQYIVDNADV
ncbi:MAG: hypothetical protein GYA87_03815, partial [Christensenellaceae bacterium]|nr:hypothetical protein [Christensenellaceae bacterium]